MNDFHNTENTVSTESQGDRTLQTYRVSQKIVPQLCGCCKGAVDSIISVLTQLHRPGFNLELDTLFESI